MQGKRLICPRCGKSFRSTSVPKDDSLIKISDIHCAGLPELEMAKRLIDKEILIRSK